jgi:hypothetical protein
VREEIGYLLTQAKQPSGVTSEQRLREALSAEAVERSWKWAAALDDAHRRGETGGKRVEALRQQVVRLADAAGKKAERLFYQAETPYRRQEMEVIRDRIVSEWQTKQNPNRERIHELETRFLKISETHGWSKQWDRDRLERIAAREEGSYIDRLLAGKPDPVLVAQLTARREALQQKEAEVRARMGDPLLTVTAPSDAQSVVAIMPDGEIKPLLWDADSNTWQARFDIPTYVKEGDYTVHIVIVQADGQRIRQTRTYHVDVTPPVGTANLQRLPDGRLLLTVETDDDVARIAALLPEGQTIPLTPDTRRPHHWYARLEAGPVENGTALTVVLTDRAHNRTTLTVSLNGSEKEAQP